MLHGLVLAALLVTQVPAPSPTYRVAMAERVTSMIEKVGAPRRHERAELARRLAGAILALDGRDALRGRTIQSAESR